MTKHYLNIRQPYHRIKIEEIEQKHGVKYMGPWHHDDFDEPLDVFYTNKPRKVEDRLAERYIGVAVVDNVMYCFAVDEIFDRVIVGVEADDGEVCISRFNEDHYVSTDETTWVDGGAEVIQTNKPNSLVRVYVRDADFEFEPLGLLEFESKVDTSRTFFRIFQWP